MSEIIAKGFLSVNSHRLIPLVIAESYYSGMRGAEKKSNRAAKLRQLNKQFTYEEMARRLGGKASPAYLSQIANEVIGKGRKTPRSLSDDYASRLEAAFNLPLGWFDSPDDQPSTSNTAPGPEMQGHVPLISWVSAGQWLGGDESPEPWQADEWVPCPVPHSDRTFVLRVIGSSMEPEYHDGDWIFVDPDRPAENGAHVVVRLEEEYEATFKKLVVDENGHKYLMALNPSWPDRVIKINGKATIVGVVIFSGKPR